MHDLRAGRPIRLAVGARLVALELGIRIAGALHALVGEVAERATADDLGERLERVLARQPLRHHEAGVDRGLAERLRQQRERTLEAEADGAVISGRELGGRLHQLAAKAVARRPAADAGDAVAGEHTLAVVPEQAVTQGEIPLQPVT